MTARRLRLGAALLFPPLAVAWAWSALLAWSEEDVATGIPEVTPAEVTISLPGVGDAAPAQLTLHNSGGRPLRLLGVEATCGCTATDLPSSRTLGPHERLAFSVRGTPPGIGEKDSWIEIHTDSEVRPVIRVAIHLKGRPRELPAIYGQPERLDLRTTRTGPLTHEFAVHTAEAVDAEPWIRSVTAERTDCVMTRLGVQTAADTPDAVRRTYRFRLEAPAPPADGSPAVVRLRLLTTSPAQVEPKPIVVVYRTVPAIRPIPEEVFFRPNSEGGFADRTIVFQAEAASAPVAIRPEPAAVDWLEVGEIEAGPAERPLVGKVTLRVLPERLSEDAAETVLTFQSDHRDRPTLAVPVHVVRPRRGGPVGMP